MAAKVIKIKAGKVSHLNNNAFEKQLRDIKFELQDIAFDYIARELHDNIGQLLSTSRMLISLAERNINKKTDTLTTANATLAKGISELRALSRYIDKERFFEFNLIENLKSEIQKYIDSKKKIVSIYSIEKPKLDSEKQLIVFRILQQIISNLINNLHCSYVKINLEEKYKTLHVIIETDNIIANEKKVLTEQVCQRVKVLNGTTDLSSNDTDSKLTILIPQLNAVK